MFFVLLRPFFFCGLEVERLTLAATFFFILLFPCGQYGTSGLPRLWKLGNSPPWQLSCQGEGRPLYTAETLDASTAPEVGQKSSNWQLANGNWLLARRIKAMRGRTPLRLYTRR